jgi:hypothetical protein
VREGGLTGAEVAIAFAAGFALVLAKEAGAAAGKKVWALLVSRLGKKHPEGLGRELDLND